jgi:hypothetical protein
MEFSVCFGILLIDNQFGRAFILKPRNFNHAATCSLGMLDNRRVPLIFYTTIFIQ